MENCQRNLKMSLFSFSFFGESFFFLKENNLFGSGDCVNRISKIINFGRNDTSHGDSTISGHVNGKFACKSINLFRSETTEAKHTDLVGDMRPISLRSCSLE